MFRKYPWGANILWYLAMLLFVISFIPVFLVGWPTLGTIWLVNKLDDTFRAQGLRHYKNTWFVRF